MTCLRCRVTGHRNSLASYRLAFVTRLSGSTRTYAHLWKKLKSWSHIRKTLCCKASLTRCFPLNEKSSSLKNELVTEISLDFKTETSISPIICLQLEPGNPCRYWQGLRLFIAEMIFLFSWDSQNLRKGRSKCFICVNIDVAWVRQHKVPSIPPTGRSIHELEKTRPCMITLLIFASATEDAVQCWEQYWFQGSWSWATESQCRNRGISSAEVPCPVFGILGKHFHIENTSKQGIVKVEGGHQLAVGESKIFQNIGVSVSCCQNCFALKSKNPQ